MRAKPCYTDTCGNPFADGDRDGDVDLDDAGAFQACLTEPGAGTILSECTCFDHDGDDIVVGQNDVGVFVSCMSGANLPADPACDDGS